MVPAVTFGRLYSPLFPGVPSFEFCVRYLLGARVWLVRIEAEDEQCAFAGVDIEYIAI